MFKQEITSPSCIFSYSTSPSLFIIYNCLGSHASVILQNTMCCFGRLASLVLEKPNFLVEQRICLDFRALHLCSGNCRQVHDKCINFIKGRHKLCTFPRKVRAGLQCALRFFNWQVLFVRAYEIVLNVCLFLVISV